MHPPEPNLAELAQEVVAALQRSGRQLVLAESCTAGLVAASLGGVPGVSEFLCGSAVVYQERTKTAWIDVSKRLLAEAGAVTSDVANAMCAGALERTPFADIAAAVTGHLGPNGPEGLDGVIFVAVQRRGAIAVIERHVLAPGQMGMDRPLRLQRQTRAAAIVLMAIVDALEHDSGHS